LDGTHRQARARISGHRHRAGPGLRLHAAGRKDDARRWAYRRHRAGRHPDADGQSQSAGHVRAAGVRRAGWRPAPAFALADLTWNQVFVGVVLLALPQIPLTLANAVIAITEENNKHFP